MRGKGVEDGRALESLWGCLRAGRVKGGEKMARGLMGDSLRGFWILSGAFVFWQGLMEATRGKLKPKLKLGVDLMRWLSWGLGA